MRRLLVIILLLGLGGCTATHQSVVVDVNINGWHESKVVVMENSDTTTLRDLEIFVRHYPTISPSQARLSVESIAPDSTSFTEEVTLHFNRHPNERGVSVLYYRPYRTNVVWQERGTYQLRFTPTNEIKGVEAIGVNIKKTDI